MPSPDFQRLFFRVRFAAGTKIGYYFAWLKFYTAALVYPTVVGLFVWWSERANHEEKEVIPDVDMSGGRML